MARKQQHPGFIPGHATHRRTEGDYMGVLLDAVSLEDWRAVVAGALSAAKAGDAQARTWLAQYLVGRPEGKAPTPLTVVVQQLSGVDALVDKLANKAFVSMKFPDSSDGLKDKIKALVAVELAEKIRCAETIEQPATARSGGPSDA